MGKFKMPTEQQFYKKKTIYDPRREPVWVYIEREMRENAHRKPYNTKVANWLMFLKDLRYHYFREAKAKYKRLCRECGPHWYLEFSPKQRDNLVNLKDYIHADLIDNVPARVQKCLWDLGLVMKIPAHTLMSAMAESMEDPGLFVWYLFTKVYKHPPSELLPRYDMDAMLLMSALVFIDLEECTERLSELTVRVKPDTPVTKKKKSTYFEPDVKYGEYLQKMNVPYYSPYPLNPPKPKKPLPLAHKVKIRSNESYEELAKRTDFLEKRKERNIKKKYELRQCKYKFWDPPLNLRNTDPKQAAYVLKINMFKGKARASHLKHKSPYDNTQCLISSVSYAFGKPIYVLHSIVDVPSGCTIINGGVAWFRGEFITQIHGMWNIDKDPMDYCDSTCNCITSHWPTVLDYLADTKCYCGHTYDYQNYDMCPPKYPFFYPPTRRIPLLFDHAQIYQFDAYFEHVRDALKMALDSNSSKSISAKGSIQIMNLPGKELLKIFLADLADSPLMIPHLPQANLLKNLQQWLKKRIKGNISPRLHRKLMLKSERRWLDLEHIDFRAQAYFIPFTAKQLQNMNWMHRTAIQKLFKKLLSNFETRTRKYQFEQSRLWWSTMAYDYYPSKSFLNMFFTYMPSKFQDTLVLDPYRPDHVKYVSGTCSLK